MARSRHSSASPGAVRLQIEAALDPSKTAAEIAEIVGCDATYVFSIARINKVSLRQAPNLGRAAGINEIWPEERLAVLRKLLDEKLSFTVIAARLNTTRSAVIGKVHRLGWSDNSRATGRPKGSVDSAPRTRFAKPKTRPAAPGVSRPVAPKFAPDYVPPPPSEYDVARKRLADLEAQDCRFPVDLPNGKGFGFCALERAPGVSYCPEHARRCINPVPVRAGQKVPANDQREKATA